MLRGPDNLTIDAKGRMPLPSRYRELMAEICQGQMVVTVDRDKCLLIYPKPTWEEVQARLEALPSTNLYAKKLRRLMIGHAQDVELDAAHRLRINPVLRDYAGIEKKVMLIGQGSKFELWDEARWRAGIEDWSDTEDDAAQMTEQLAELRW